MSELTKKFNELAKENAALKKRLATLETAVIKLAMSVDKANEVPPMPGTIQALQSKMKHAVRR